MTDHNITAKEQLDCAWKHFVFIADQRLRSFNFYIILLAASIGGTIAVFEKIGRFTPVLMCGLWHIVVGAVFVAMDIRSRRLLEVPKEALRWFESHESWTGPKLILRDDERMRGFARFISFTSAFRSTFVGQALIGGWIVCYALRHL